MNKTVYLLGAGASKGSQFGLPTMDEFFAKFQPDNYPHLSEYLSSRFPTIPIPRLNLEEVVTQLELSLSGFGSMWRGGGEQAPRARNELDRFIHSKLMHFELDVPEHKDVLAKAACEIHEKIFGHMDPAGDSVISLNYDLIADCTLWKLSEKNDHGQLKHGTLFDRSQHLLGPSRVIHGERPSLYHGYEGKGYYVKLHGSLNWLYCSNPQCFYHQLFFDNWLGSREVWNKPGDPCMLCGTPLVSVIIPPAMSKSFELFPKMGLLWNLAYRELRSAVTWVIIGVSLPDSDYILKWLLRESAAEREKRPDVIIVNPCMEARERIERAVGTKTKSFNGLVEYVDSLTKEDD